MRSQAAPDEAIYAEDITHIKAHGQCYHEAERDKPLFPLNKNPVPIPVLRQMITASIESFLAGGETEASYAGTLAAMIDIIMNGIRRRDHEVSFL